MKQISIIIPTHNEGENIIYIVRKLDEVLRKHEIAFQILIIDDNSTDLTQHIIQLLEHAFPVKLFIKHGKKGKTQSILEGFTYVQYATVAIVDPDSRYSAENIPRMLEEMQKGFDVVVANRKGYPKDYAHVFSTLLYHLTVDVTSGCKIFRKEIMERLLHHVASGNFDVQFLAQAQNAGYKITGIAISFPNDISCKKISMASALWNIAGRALFLKLTQQEVIPFSKEQRKKDSQGFHYKGKAFTHFSTLSLTESAFFPLTTKQRQILFLALGSFFLACLFNWHTTFIILFTVITLLYFSDLLFNFYLILLSFYNHPEIRITNEELTQRGNWPSYTILCPLYKESTILPQFIHAIEKIDYPKSQLQVILLLEKDDEETQEKIKNIFLPNYFSLLQPPQASPKTKPKALNFGLLHAKGEYCVVYDAEDIPDPLQLKKVVVAFEKSSPSIQCMQAKLNFYNPFQNILTRVFTAEYSLWFELILTGLQSSQTIIPLGGTSNHFRTHELRKLHGWDSFNVTEDCDLGLRLAKYGYQTAIVNSTTLEEANSEIFNWFQQRGRWIKGYMQTYLVHIRQPKQFIHNGTMKKFFVFQMIVGGKILSLFINPIMWATTLVYFIFRPHVGTFIESFFPNPILYLGVFSLVFGNFLYLYYYMIGCAKRQQYGLIKYAFFVPFYWLCMSISAFNAIYTITRRPHEWAKTRHGLYLRNQHSQELPEKRILANPFTSPTLSV